MVGERGDQPCVQPQHRVQPGVGLRQPFDAAQRRERVAAGEPVGGFVDRPCRSARGPRRGPECVEPAGREGTGPGQCVAGGAQQAAGLLDVAAHGGEVGAQGARGHHRAGVARGVGGGRRGVGAALGVVELVAVPVDGGERRVGPRRRRGAVPAARLGERQRARAPAWSARRRPTLGELERRAPAEAAQQERVALAVDGDRGSALELLGRHFQAPALELRGAVVEERERPQRVAVRPGCRRRAAARPTCSRARVEVAAGACPQQRAEPGGVAAVVADRRRAALGAREVAERQGRRRCRDRDARVVAAAAPAASITAAGDAPSSSSSSQWSATSVAAERGPPAARACGIASRPSPAPASQSAARACSSGSRPGRSSRSRARSSSANRPW